MTVHFYITQDISNGYFRPLFEIHRKWCNFITMEKMFGSAMRQGRLKKPCPHPPIRYISTERPHISYVNDNFFEYINVTSRRFNRKNPFYYVDIHFKILFTVDNNTTMNFYLSQDTGNGYFRLLFEIHKKWCIFLAKDGMFGNAMRQGKLKKPCPHPPDIYRLYNMSIPVENIPRSLPYFKGRIYCNVTHNSVKEPIFSAYIDMELKEYKKQ
ncbi:uncharacterized protein LOC131846956 [Achroia grisella]|uniref:uncharacterized protein LOC131846956 n=1 Tax=Achroia grisella TaxID=688607 RepID=UPI0027D21673|nr:uncharacterized protein LOC131846956 [Achroia grisella]